MKKLLKKINRWRRLKQERRYKRYQAVYDHGYSFSQAVTNYHDPNKLYAYMHHYERYHCPQIIQDHRNYFKEEQRAFGEDAFHAMWWLLISEFKPQRMLEIGVYRGQVISLWALIAQIIELKCEVHGISPFTPIGDAVSKYIEDLDYEADILASFAHFNLPAPNLVKAYSTDQVAYNHIMKYKWDLIYIDGNHEYEIVLADYKLCKKQLTPNGIIVLDDASIGTAYRPTMFSFAGHLGPSKVARQYADKEMRYLGAVGHNNVYQNI
jgi:predicted O-methyltransferase YrrM